MIMTSAFGVATKVGIKVQTQHDGELLLRQTYNVGEGRKAKASRK